LVLSRKQRDHCGGGAFEEVVDHRGCDVQLSHAERFSLEMRA
jgi:hypothetical protein